MRAPVRKVSAAASASGLAVSLGLVGCLLVTHEDDGVYGIDMADASMRASGDGSSVVLADSGRVDAAVAETGPLDAGSDAADAAAAPCPGSAGPPGVRVSAGFCIDSTEVTVADYAAFLPHAGEVALSPECADGGTFTPTNWPSQTEMQNPVSAATWCDAQAYCAWAGKRLCGHVGGGAITLNSNQDAVEQASNEWAYACSRGGQIAYPYGSDYQGQACNGGDNTAGGGALVHVATLPGCEGGFAGIFDMSGNVGEWTNACDDAGNCQALGGSIYTSGETALSCASLVAQPRTKQGDYDLGIRCCAD